MAYPKVKLFLLGGTITMQAASSSPKGVVPSIDAAALCGAVPGLDRVAHVDPRTDKMVASSNLSYQQAISLADEIRQADLTGECDGFVIVQGTDTLEEMAFLLDCMLDIKSPVVVTGAMRNPSQLSADGPANILSAVTCAGDRAIGLAGVVVVMNDEIHSARYVTKSHTSDVGAFRSTDIGPIGRVVEGRARLFTVPMQGPKINIPTDLPVPNIALVKATYGDEGYFLNVIAQSNCQGLIIEAFGAGHLPESYLKTLDQMVLEHPVILSSRVGGGHVFRETYGYKGAEIDLISRGLIPSGILTGPKAKILLTLLLMNKAGLQDITTAFEGWNI